MLVAVCSYDIFTAAIVGYVVESWYWRMADFGKSGYGGVVELLVAVHSLILLSINVFRLDSSPASFPFDGNLPFNTAVNLVGKGVQVYFVLYFWLASGLGDQCFKTLAVNINLPDCFRGFLASALDQNGDNGWGLGRGFCPAGVDGRLVG